MTWKVFWVLIGVSNVFFGMLYVFLKYDEPTGWHGLVNVTIGFWLWHTETDHESNKKTT